MVVLLLLLLLLYAAEEALIVGTCGSRLPEELADHAQEGREAC